MPSMSSQSISVLTGAKGATEGQEQNAKCTQLYRIAKRAQACVAVAIGSLSSMALHNCSIAGVQLARHARCGAEYFTYCQWIDKTSLELT
eukprot:2237503-Amphidinium_carterae.1